MVATLTKWEKKGSLIPERESRGKLAPLPLFLAGTFFFIVFAPS